MENQFCSCSICTSPTVFFMSILVLMDSLSLGCLARACLCWFLGCKIVQAFWIACGSDHLIPFVYLSRFSDVFGPACLARMMNLNPVCKENQPYLSFFHMDEHIPIWCSIFMPEQPCKFLIPSLTKMDRSMHWWIEFIRFISSIAWVLRHLAWSCHTAKSVAAGRFGASIAKMWFVCFCCFSSKDIFE